MVNLVRDSVCEVRERKRKKNSFFVFLLILRYLVTRWEIIVKSLKLEILCVFSATYVLIWFGDILLKYDILKKKEKTENNLREKRKKAKKKSVWILRFPVFSDLCFNFSVQLAADNWYMD